MDSIRRASSRAHRRAKASLWCTVAVAGTALVTSVLAAGPAWARHQKSASVVTVAATLNPGQVGTVGTTFNQSCDQGPGWIFVLPASSGDAFVSLSATFQSAGTVPGTVLSNPKFASVNVPLTDKLLGATAVVTNGPADATFNLTHVCNPETGTTTTTASTTTTAPATTTTTTAPATTTTSTTTVPGTTTTTASSTTTVPGTTSTTVASSTTVATSTTVFSEGSTVVSTSTTGAPTSVTQGGSATTAGAPTGTGGSNLPFTGGSGLPALLGLGTLASGVALAVLSKRRNA